MKRKGGILIEFIILLPILIVFMAGIYSLGQYIDTKMKLEMAARIAAQQVANPKLKDQKNAMYYPYGPEGGMASGMGLGIFGKDITGFLYNLNYGLSKRIAKMAWRFVDPNGDIPAAGSSIGFYWIFAKGRKQADKDVKKYLQLAGLPIKSDNFKLEVRVNPTYVATDKALLPYNNSGDVAYDAFHSRPGGARQNRRKGVASVHPAYWKWNNVKDHQNRWVDYPHSFADEWRGAKINPNKGEEPKHFDKDGTKYTYNHYTFPVGGWIVVAKVKYKMRIPFAGSLVRIASAFMGAPITKKDSVFDYMWLDGTAAFPAPMSIYDIMDADTALHKAQMEAEPWQ